MTQRLKLALVAVVAAATLGAAVYFRAGVAPLPPVFSEHLSLGEAERLSAANGKPVLVLGSADWCAPCQVFKRTALIDPGVEAYIRAHFVPVYLNVDEHQDEAGVLAITSLPASIVMKNGKRLAKLEGVVRADELLAWLRSTAEGEHGR